jgi:hypothetical protein
MPALENYRHERFAQELANGHPADKAYEFAGYQYSRPNCVRLKQDENILKRVDELLARQAARVDISRTDVLKMLLEDREAARAAGQHAVALKAAELLGKELHRMFVDRKEIGLPGEFETLQSMDELVAQLRAEHGERIAAALELVVNNQQLTIEHQEQPEQSTDQQHSVDMPSADDQALQDKDK